MLIYLKIGARNTQISRMCTGMFSRLRTQCIEPDVTMRPGYTFQKHAKWTRIKKEKMFPVSKCHQLVLKLLTQLLLSCHSQLPHSCRSSCLSLWWPPSGLPIFSIRPTCQIVHQHLSGYLLKIIYLFCSYDVILSFPINFFKKILITSPTNNDHLLFIVFITFHTHNDPHNDHQIFCDPTA